MPNIDRYIKYFYGLLQTYDTCLGIDHRGDAIILVKIRKQGRRYKILKQLSVPCKDGHIGNVLSQSINEHKLHSTYMTANLPRSNALVRKVSIPLMPEHNYIPFLYQNPDLCLPPNVEVNEVAINFKALKAGDDAIEGIVFVARIQQLTEFLKQFHDENGLPGGLIYDGFTLDNLVRVYFPDYSGLMFHIEENSVLILDYVQGEMTGYHHFNDHDPKWNDVLKLLPEKEHNNKSYLLSASEEVISPVESFMSGPEYQNINNLLPTSNPKFNHALALSLTPFAGTDNPFDLNLKQNKGINAGLFHKHLTKKWAVFSASLIIFLFLVLSGAKGLLNWHYDQLESDFKVVQPLIAERDSLIDQNTVLNRLLQDLRYRSSQKTFSAFYIYQIAQRLPDQLWLSKMTIETGPENQNVVRLSGYAFSDSEVAALLKQLENVSYVQNLILDEMTVLSGKEINKVLKRNYKSLVQFRMHFDVRA